MKQYTPKSEELEPENLGHYFPDKGLELRLWLNHLNIRKTIFFKLKVAPPSSSIYTLIKLEQMTENTHQAHDEHQSGFTSPHQPWSSD